MACEADSDSDLSAALCDRLVQLQRVIGSTSSHGPVAVAATTLLAPMQQHIRSRLDALEAAAPSKMRSAVLAIEKLLKLLPVSIVVMVPIIVELLERVAVANTRLESLSAAPINPCVRDNPEGNGSQKVENEEEEQLNIFFAALEICIREITCFVQDFSILVSTPHLVLTNLNPNQWRNDESIWKSVDHIVDLIDKLLGQSAIPIPLQPALSCDSVKTLAQRERQWVKKVFMEVQRGNHFLVSQRNPTEVNYGDASTALLKHMGDLVEGKTVFSAPLKGKWKKISDPSLLHVQRGAVVSDDAIFVTVQAVFKDLPVVVKIAKGKECLGVQAHVDRVLLDASLLSTYTHEKIVQFHGVCSELTGEGGGRELLLVYEDRGTSLREVMEQLNGEPMATDAALVICDDVAQAAVFLEKNGARHGHLSPGMVWCFPVTQRAQGEPAVASKICSFVPTSESEANWWSLSDGYAIAALLYCLLTGQQLPSDGEKHDCSKIVHDLVSLELAVVLQQNSTTLSASAIGKLIKKWRLPALTQSLPTFAEVTGTFFSPNRVCLMMAIRLHEPLSSELLLPIRRDSPLMKRILAEEWDGESLMELLLEKNERGEKILEYFGHSQDVLRLVARLEAIYKDKKGTEEEQNWRDFLEQVVPFVNEWKAMPAEERLQLLVKVRLHHHSVADFVRQNSAKDIVDIAWLQSTLADNSTIPHPLKLRLIKTVKAIHLKTIVLPAPFANVTGRTSAATFFSTLLGEVENCEPSNCAVFRSAFVTVVEEVFPAMKKENVTLAFEVARVLAQRFRSSLADALSYKFLRCCCSMLHLTAQKHFISGEKQLSGPLLASWLDLMEALESAPLYQHWWICRASVDFFTVFEAMEKNISPEHRLKFARIFVTLFSTSQLLFGSPSKSCQNVAHVLYHWLKSNSHSCFSCCKFAALVAADMTERREGAVKYLEQASLVSSRLSLAWALLCRTLKPAEKYKVATDDTQDEDAVTGMNCCLRAIELAIEECQPITLVACLQWLIENSMQTVKIHGELFHLRDLCMIAIEQSKDQYSAPWYHLSSHVGNTLAEEPVSVVEFAGAAYNAMECAARAIQLSEQCPIPLHLTALAKMLRDRLHVVHVSKEKQYSQLDLLSLALKAEMRDRTCWEVWETAGKMLLTHEKLNVSGEIISKRDCFVAALERNSSLKWAWYSAAMLLLTPEAQIVVERKKYNRRQCLVRCLAAEPNLEAAEAKVYAALGDMLEEKEEQILTEDGNVKVTKVQAFCRAVELQERSFMNWLKLLRNFPPALRKKRVSFETEGVKYDLEEVKVRINGVETDRQRCCAKCFLLSTSLSEESLVWCAVATSLKASPGSKLLINGREFDRAQCYAEAISRERTNSHHWALLGDSLLGSPADTEIIVGAKKMKKLEIFCTVLQLQPKSIAAWWNLAMELSPTTPVQHVGTVYTKIKCFEEVLQRSVLPDTHAAVWFRIAAELFPAQRRGAKPPVVKVLGVERSRIDCCVLALTVDPCHSWSWKLAADIIGPAGTVLVAGRQYNYCECYGKYVEHNKQDDVKRRADAWARIGNNLMTNNDSVEIGGDMKTAAQCFEESLNLIEDQPDVWELLHSLPGPWEVNVKGRVVRCVQLPSSGKK